MAIDATDWSVAVNGDIRYIGDDHGGASPTYATVLELHRWLKDLADNAEGSGDDLLDITDVTPSSRSFDGLITLNAPYNIDDAAAQHLYGGRIVQDNGDTYYDAIVNFGSFSNAEHIEIMQDGALIADAFWNEGPGSTGLNGDAAQGISHRFLVKTRANGVDIDGRRLIGMAREFNNTYSEFSINGTAAGENVFALSDASDLNNATAAATVATWSTIANTEGYQTLDLGGGGEPYYSQWDKGSQSINDTYERGKWLTRRGTASTIHGLSGDLFRGITHEWAYDTEAGTSPVTNDEYAWGLKVDYDNEANGPFVVGEAVTFGGSSAKRGRILMLDDNGVTGTMIVSMEAGAPADNDQIASVTGTATADVNLAPVGQATGGGMGRILAVNDGGTTGTVWIQLLKGTAPADNAICYELSDVANVLTVNGAVTTRSISAGCFLGTSTGTNIIGAFGIGFDVNDVGSSDSFTDLLNANNTPPNNVTFTVSGLVASEDYILVTNDNAGAPDKAQLTLSTDLTGAAETSVVVTTTIPSDTPSSGTIRVVDDLGVDRKLAYSSFTGSTFTITAEDFTAPNDATGAKNVYITYLDKLAGATSENFTYVYSADRTHFIRVRDGGAASPIQDFETTGTMGSGGGSATVVRTPDT